MEGASIVLKDVWIEYVIYGLANRSLKKTLFRFLSRGRMAQEVAEERTRVLALKGIDLEIRDGERLGIVGSNGSGKTTLLRAIAGVLKPVRGQIRRVGYTASLFDVTLGMNPEASGWDNILLRGLYLGLSPEQARALSPEIAAFSGLTPEQLSRPVRTYSSGMQVKLAFSISTAVRPDILLLDEWLGAGDAAFLEKAQQRMLELVQRSRILVFASHYDWLLSSICNRAICLDQGQIVADGPVAETLDFYHRHFQ